MCYSEKLTEKAAGYQTEHGYVLVGRKAVVKRGSQIISMWEEQGYWTFGFGSTEGSCTWRSHRKANLEALPLRRLIIAKEDEHPFHVGCSLKGAQKAVRGMTWQTRLRRGRRGGFRQAISISRRNRQWRQNIKLCRVLVPEKAVLPDNHVTAMLIIPPGERETETDIRLCEDYNRRDCLPVEKKISHEQSHPVSVGP